MANVQPGCRLMNLPLDVHQMIVECLDLPDLLFPPAYHQELLKDISCGDCHFNSQHARYYGPDRNRTNHPAAYALLRWSSTCRFYRQLFRTRLLRDVVLRPQLKSIRSLEAIAATSAWQDVKGLIVCNSLNELEDAAADWETGTHYEDSDTLAAYPEFPLSRIAAVLSNLPPNLESLTLDFPWHWIDHENDCMELSATGDYGRMVHLILSTIGKKGMAHKPSFKLRLLNLPKGSAWQNLEENVGLRNLLHSVTDCQISLQQWDNGAGWEQNTVACMEEFTAALGPLYIKSLTGVKTLELQSNISCPIGLAPGQNHVYFPQLDADTVFPYLENLTFDHFFLDEPLITFVVDQSPNLKHLNLFTCAASVSDGGVSEITEPPTWAEFFTRLTTGAQNLQSLTFRHRYSNRQLLDVYNSGGEPDPDAKSAYVVLDLQDSQRHTMSEREWTRRKRILPHGYLDDKYGMFFDGEEENAEKFLVGEDHRALLELWDAMEGRGGEGVVYLDALPDYPSDGED